MLFWSNIHRKERDRGTDSISCPMLITRGGTDGDAGIFGINREMSETDASLIVSSSIEFERKSCTKKENPNQWIFLKFSVP